MRYSSVTRRVVGGGISSFFGSAAASFLVSSVSVLTASPVEQ